MAVIAAGMTALAALVPAGTSSAATATGGHRLLLPFAGSGRYLLYIVGQPGDNIAHAVLRGSVYAMARNGEAQRVGALDQDHTYALAGSLVVIPERTKDHSPSTTIHWLNLDTGRRGEGHLKVPRGGYFKGVESAAPNGWIYSTGDARSYAHPLTLWYQKTDGTTTKLGSPIKYNNEPLVADGARRVVVSGPENHGSQISWASYKKPGRFHALAAGSTGDNYCSSPRHGLTACASSTIVGHSGPGIQLLPLDGSRPTVTTGPCAADANAPQVFHSRAAVWITSDRVEGCAGGHLESLSVSGSRKHGTRMFNATTTYGLVGLTNAFGRLIATSPSHRTIYTLRSVTASPKVLIHTP
jgi:hypothetical protein